MGEDTLNISGLETPLGQLKVTNEVIAILSGIAAMEEDGVYAMSGGITGELAQALGIKNLSKGVKIETDEEGIHVNIYVIVELGVRIPDVAWSIQEKVKKMVEKMTGSKVAEVNIHVQGVNIFKGKENLNENI
ncbi:MAG: Asp23/Gls24 family envelope stress response protein [Clostridia bacterium]|jgi:uncharacterized alkaline shock family protein YloU|nr:Asp23/Gls24 family envelope stress response protein [Clostridia bacterium]MDD4543166.1 Asp23/Gls24 family envelope stress response protein [Clostridia bacterium]NLF37630.1 Asp23/Gls24 family envelope stress response protein [Clostridiaceae bacterium]HXK71584.1 Asp23/Gls24 family envelope stress response protein [Clostridia bacterium]